MFLLDTNTLIYFFRGQGRVAEHLFDAPRTTIAVATVSIYELETGIAKSTQPAKRRKQLAALLDAVKILPFDRSAARHAAELRVALEKNGRPIGPLDTLIAGTALAHQATLVTHNTGEFKRVPKLTLLDWY